MIRALVVAAAALAACSVDTRSSAFRCDQGTCPSDRTCVAGWCVSTSPSDGGIDAPPGPDAAPCPAACSSCAGDACIIRCDPNNSCPAQVVCPAGMPCVVECDGNNSCAGGVDCSAATACTITCSGPSSCAAATTCGTGACDVACSGKKSCNAAVQCGQACQCDVECTGQNSCGTAAMCPAPTDCTSGNGCASTPADCPHC